MMGSGTVVFRSIIKISPNAPEEIWTLVLKVTQKDQVSRYLIDKEKGKK